MKFKNLEDRMLYRRSLTDYKLIPNDYVLIMLDGRSFSSTIKRYFKKTIWWYIDWNDFDDGKKYGRFIYKEEVHMKSEQFGEFIRDKFVVHNAWLLRDENGKKNFEKLSKIPQKWYKNWEIFNFW